MANLQHGLPLTTSERNRVFRYHVSLPENAEKSNRTLAVELGSNKDTIRRIRKIARRGKTYTIHTANIGNRRGLSPEAAQAEVAPASDTVGVTEPEHVPTEVPAPAVAPWTPHPGGRKKIHVVEPIPPESDSDESRSDSVDPESLRKALLQVFIRVMKHTSKYRFISDRLHTPASSQLRKRLPGC